MSFTFRPAVRENTPLIIGLAGATKSGKTFSALRLAVGLANGGPIAMINAEGPRGHQYADKFKYVACDIEAPFRPEKYTEVLKAAAAIKPAVVIIDSVSHMHDGPGGILEYHEDELDRLTGKDQGRRDKMNFAAWVRPKQAENEFIYTMLATKCALILCMRAKEKIKLVNGKPVEMGWQPIVGERVAFETIFTLMLPPHSRGVPDLSISEMREPFDMLVPKGKPIDEALGKILAAWSKGKTAVPPPPAAEPQPIFGKSAEGPDDPLFSEREDRLAAIDRVTTSLAKPIPDDVWRALTLEICGTEDLKVAELATLDDLCKLLDGIARKDKASISRANAIVTKARKAG